jgi:hypothetical protein
MREWGKRRAVAKLNGKLVAAGVWPAQLGVQLSAVSGDSENESGDTSCVYVHSAETRAAIWLHLAA